jgi:NDP-sugar pyrophosphorylase family protein
MMRNLSEITAAILAGGFGTRLRPVVSDQPKVLAGINGRPFLSYLLDQVMEAGVRKVVLCTGYLGGQIRSVLGETYRGLSLIYSQEQAPLGTAGALKLAFPLFQSDSVLVMNGDSFCRTDLEAFWDWHQARNANATILLTEVSNTNRYGRVEVDANSRVTQFSEKGNHGGSGWINAGIYLIQRNMFLNIPSNRPVSLEREILPSWVGQGLYGYLSRGLFIDIGIPETFAEAKKYQLGNRI